jgi:hypothetical protein
MIQRIQSIFLFLVAASLVTMLFFPLWNKVDNEKNEIVTLSTFSFKHEKKDIDTGELVVISEGQVYYIAGVLLLAVAIALYSIFRFDNRLLQMKLGALNSLVMGLGVIGVSIYHIFQAEKVIAPQIQGNYLFAFYMGVAAMLFNLLSNRFIRKDEQLVKSADRIR